MKKSILDYMLDKNNGLMIADMPTGFGKTYNSILAMYEYLYDEKETRRIFYITQLKKNLPIKDLKNIYEANKNKNFDKDVLVIKSNYDYIYENFLKVDIPDRFKDESYNKLKRELENLKALEKKSEDYLLSIKYRIQEEIRQTLEPAFRKNILKIIQKNLPKSKVQRKEIIKKDKNFNWISNIYPTVFMEDYKIYFLTIDKFLVKNTVLIEPSYFFIDSNIIENSIIFIDEFDSGKDTVEKSLIKRALESRTDYIKLFLKIYQIFENHEFTKEMLELSSNINEKYNLETLKKQAYDIFREFKLTYNYKTIESSIDNRQSFLFNDSSYHTMLRNNKSYIRATENKEQKRIDIYFEDRDEYYKNKTEEDLIIYSLVRKIVRFLNRFKLMILIISSKYSKKINDIRSDKADKFTVENAMNTIYNEFSLNDNEIDILMDKICVDFELKYKSDEDIMPDISFYTNGFKYFEFEDSDKHLNETKFSCVNISNTPEKIILYLSKKAKLIGLSATGRIKTVTGNYDLDYLESVLGDNLKYIPKDVYSNIKIQLEKDWLAYRENKININVELVNENEKSLEIQERLNRIFIDIKYARRYMKKLNVTVKDRIDGEYILHRYCNIFKVLKEFVLKEDIKSFLCLNMVLPKEGNENFDLNIIESAMKDLIKINNINENIHLKVLNSNNFDQSKQEIQEKLQLGDKVFIMSSYKTIGAGQNLQYKFSDYKDLVVIGNDVSKEDPRLENKDIDAIFLGDITNVAVNIYNDEGIDRENLLKYFFQIEYLYENDEINYSDLDGLFKLGCKRFSKNMIGNQYYGNLKESKSIKRQVTRDVIQAIGRMCRTYVKNRNIYIYTVEELANKMDIKCLNESILTPEMEAFVNRMRSIYPYDEETNKLINRAERISTRGKFYIMSLLSRGWSEEKMKLWKVLREVVMKYPTADEIAFDKVPIISSLYLDSENNIDKYLFAQNGDFDNVVIDFENDIEVFKNNGRCKYKYISEMSEKESSLEIMLKYPGLKEYFIKNKFAISFEKNRYLMSPILFNNIYKGALGEFVGKYILEKEIGIILSEIEDAEKFEFFDFEIFPGVYIDFKHWKVGYKDRIESKKDIMKKLEYINGKKVYIVKIIGDSKEESNIENDQKIVEISGLIDKNGKIIKKNMDILRGEIINDEN